VIAAAVAVGGAAEIHHLSAIPLFAALVQVQGQMLFLPT
jgi:hypothetical protein